MMSFVPYGALCERERPIPVDRSIMLLASPAAAFEGGRWRASGLAVALLLLLAPGMHTH